MWFVGLGVGVRGVRFMFGGFFSRGGSVRGLVLRFFVDIVDYGVVLLF